MDITSIIIIIIIIVDIISVVSAPHICQLQLHHHQWQYYKRQISYCDRYGQCWVFAGVVTTVCRAIGLPCRSFDITHISHTQVRVFRHNSLSHRQRHTQTHKYTLTQTHTHIIFADLTPATPLPTTPMQASPLTNIMIRWQILDGVEKF